MALAMAIRSCPEHKEVPCSAGDRFGLAEGNAYRLSNVCGEPDVLAVARRMLRTGVLNIGNTVRVELTTLLDDAEDGRCVCLFGGSYQRNS